MRVLLTGATGFIGKHVLSSLLDAGHEVWAVSSRAQSEGRARLVWLEANLLKEGEVKDVAVEAKADVLIHLAWYTEHGKFWASEENFRWVHASEILLDEFIQQGGKRAVFSGTCAEYDWGYGYCEEGVTPTNPHSLYGKTKDYMRYVLQTVCERNNVEAVWGRIFIPFGYGEPNARLLPSVIHALLKGDFIQCTHGEQFRDFMHVSDVANAFLHLAVGTKETGIFNVSSGVPTKIKELISFCAQQFEASKPPDYGSIQAPTNDSFMLVGDNKRLKSTGWKQLLTWQSGIKLVLNDYKNKER